MYFQITLYALYKNCTYSIAKVCSMTLAPYTSLSQSPPPPYVFLTLCTVLLMSQPGGAGVDVPLAGARTELTGARTELTAGARTELAGARTELLNAHRASSKRLQNKNDNFNDFGA
jgi:hypothetical protein